MGFLVLLVVFITISLLSSLAIVKITVLFCAKFSINSLSGKSAFLGAITFLGLFILSFLVYGFFSNLIILNLVLAIILALFSFVAFWLSKKFGYDDKIGIPVILLSSVLVIMLTYYGYIMPNQKPPEAGIAQSENHVDISNYEKQLLNIIHEFKECGVLSKLPDNYDRLLTGSTATLGGKEQIQFILNDKLFNNAVIKAVGELEHRVGRDRLLELMLESYKRKKFVSFLDSAGLDYIGRDVFYSELNKKK